MDRLPVTTCARSLACLMVGFWAMVGFPIVLGAVVFIPYLVGTVVCALFTFSCKAQYGNNFYVVSYVLGVVGMTFGWMCMSMPLSWYMPAACIFMQVFFPAVLYFINSTRKEK